MFAQLLERKNVSNTFVTVVAVACICARTFAVTCCFKKNAENMFHAETKILSLPLRVIVRVDVQQIILPIVEMVVVPVDIAVC